MKLPSADRDQAVRLQPLPQPVRDEAGSDAPPRLQSHGAATGSVRLVAVHTAGATCEGLSCQSPMALCTVRLTGRLVPAAHCKPGRPQSSYALELAEAQGGLPAPRPHHAAVATSLMATARRGCTASRQAQPLLGRMAPLSVPALGVEAGFWTGQAGTQCLVPAKA